MLPKNWREIELADLSVKPISYGIVQTGESIKKGVPCVRVVDLTASKIDFCKMITTSEEISQSYKKTILEKGELMLALRGEIGLVRMVDEQLAGCNLTRGIARISPNTKMVLPEFLLWAIRSPLFRDDLLRRVNGSALQEIPIAELRKTIVPVPPLHEQKKIAEILVTWDEAIALTERAIEAKQKLKNSTQKHLLSGSFRFDQFKTTQWKMTCLKDCVAFVRDGTHGTHQRIDAQQGVPLLSAVNISKYGEIIINSDTTYISKGEYQKIHSKYELEENDLLLTVVGTLGRRALILKSTPKFAFQRSVAVIRFRESILPRFAYHYAGSTLFQYELKKRANVTAQPGVYLGELEKMRIPLLRLEEQKRIADLLDKFDQEIRILRELKNSYQRQKQGLMQKLLTGEWRVAFQEAA